MTTFKGMTDLELAESFAEWNPELHQSEDDTSERFDTTIAPLVIEQYGADDKIAMSEAFNNWTDSECREGFMHESQYNQYCYVGEYA